jgi:hypothetical protein
MFSNFPENRAVYEIMWNAVVEPERPQITVGRMHIACWTPKATNTHSECVILNCFSTATLVTRWRLNVTLHVHCMSYLSHFMLCFISVQLKH